jgi:YVTN family beta-propeller protein
MRRAALCAALVTAVALVACGGGSAKPPAADAPPAHAIALTHSSSIAVSADGATVYVVNADADSVSVLDAHARTLTAEIALAASPPAPDPTTGAYTPAVMPRMLALSPDGKTLYVTGERAGALFAIDVATRAVTGHVAVGSEPIGVVVSDDGSSIYVACSQDATVVRVDAATLAVSATATVTGEPWALGWTPDGTLLATLFMGPGVAAIDPTAMTVAATDAIPDVAPRGDARLAHGSARGFYDIAARPGSGAAETWVAHALLGIDTAQPALDFERTVFPALSLLDGSGAHEVTLSTDAQDVPGVDGSFADVVSGPHAFAFTSDGGLALLVDTDSEDVLVVDATRRVEASLVRPLPGHMPEGIAISPDGTTAYVDERNTADVAVLAITGTTVAVDGAPIARLASDPMPATLRLGQHLFYSANSDEYPITKNHWVSCASCHMEGRSDEVTWKFAQGPRDTPTNAGGMTGTGFLFRTADRTAVQDYSRTIATEQGGNFDPVGQKALLDALAAYVNQAIPAPIPPTTDPTKVARGAMIFTQVAGCSSCHAGPRFTDSGTGNPTLDLTGTVLLHDATATGLGTCVTTGYPDVAHDDIDGDPRAACMFDTPSLTGVASTPPYLHDGSAPTLHDVLEKTRGKMGDITSLSADDEDALVEYLRSL